MSNIKWYETSDGNLVGWCQVATPFGSRVIARAVPLAPIARSVRTMALRRLAAQAKGDAVGEDEVGFFKFLARAWNGIKKAVGSVVRAIARSKIVRGIVKAAKAVGRFVSNVVKSPVFAGIIGVVSAVVPGVGPLIGAGYAAVRSAVAVAEGVAKGIKPAVEGLASLAARGPSKALALVQSVKPMNAAVPAELNPWLKDWRIAA